ncbi:hypothetical protein [Paraburkholderia sp.]|uniref:hypothetical protein n=1 Tax=Paraburkholderia sp. TaxID=1926495 RepID=UPI002384B51A|nr:hypothetical protein [Paraburkholderia sp.]MDE1181998.1 hypothetical protein [Paraburkholderia sp.]
MPTSQHKFSIRELLEALLRDQGIHEGHWALNMDFLANGTSVRPQAGDDQLQPGLIVSVTGAGLVQMPEGTEGAVDAALVNPRKPSEESKVVRTRKPHTTTLQ